jgi:hypothetical protein
MMCFITKPVVENTISFAAVAAFGKQQVPGDAAKNNVAQL